MGRKSKYATDEERREAKRERDRARIRDKKPHILVRAGATVNRWQALRDQQDLHTDREVADFLLDHYDRSVAVTSTPFLPGKRTRTDSPDRQSVGGASNISKLSGISVLAETPTVQGGKQMDSQEDAACPDSESEDPDPLGLLCGLDEPVYQPTNESVHSFLRESAVNRSKYYMDTDELEAMEPEQFIMLKEEEGDPPELPTTIPQATQTTDIIGDPVCLAYQSCILELAAASMQRTCKKCGLQLFISTSQIGTAIILTWKCVRGHENHKWSSQRRLSKRGVNAGDFMLASSILLSGNHHVKIALLMKALGMKPMTKSFYYQVQSLYCLPVITAYWGRILEATHNKYPEGVVPCVVGDARMDSPGHCAMYATYTLMDEATHDIIAIKSIDKREVDGKSPNMEPEALRRCIENLRGVGITIQEMVTDAHIQIPPILREHNIIHQWDVWHGGKNFQKKLTAKASEKECKELQAWIPDIVNHFWKAAEMADGNPDKFKSMMRGCLYHVVDEHEWVSGDGVGPAACLHGELDDDRNKSWLVKDSPPHKALRAIVLDRTGLKNAAKFHCNFRHTTELEVFHHHINMYAPKQHSYSYQGYDARMKITAIDFMYHKDRPYLQDSQGNIRFNRIFNKKSKLWRPSPLKENKSYGYLSELQGQILELQMGDGLPIKRRRPMARNDPRHIRPNIAPVSPKPVAQLVEEHRTRLGNKSRWALASITNDIQGNTATDDTEGQT